VNKDGTIRYDMTELPLTHFKPIEIGTSVSVLKKLGYTHDYKGGALVSEDQVVEIKPQDVVLPSCPDSVEEGSDIVLLRVASFIDDLLKNFYSMKAYYNLKDKKDLVGHLVVALAPHTSAGTVCRILGFSKTQGFYTHPLLHCALRRDCDGDEAAVMLLMDSFLNFSKKYLPSHRGAVQDAPLVLTSQLIPSEVDDMVFDMDIAFEYPLEFYEQTEKYGMPWDVEVNRFGNVLKTEKQYEGMGFTHDVSDINNGVLCSSYKSIPTMKEKVFGQMDIAEKVRAVDELDVARLVIERHFVRDIKGNLRKFSMQQFRCVGCNEKYRRPPLSGICLKCGGKLLFTIAEGSIVKYLEPSIELARKYKLPAYLQQTLDLVKQRIESVFGRDEDKQAGLQTWFG
jgi:DNA polymerase II large subunit